MSKELKDNTARLQGELAQLNSHNTRIQTELNLAKTEVTKKDKLIKEHDAQQKSTKPVRTQKAKMEFLLSKVKQHKIPIYKNEWEEFAKIAEPKYEKETSKYPSFQYTKVGEKTVTKRPPAETVTAQTEQLLPQNVANPHVHVINWRRKNHSVIEASDSDTDDDYISDGDTTYSNHQQINTLDLHTKTKSSGQPKTLFTDQTAKVNRTPGLQLDDAMIFASTPSTTIQLTPTQLEQFQQTLESIKPRVNLKLSDISTQGKDQNLAEWGRSLYGIIQKSNWTADDFQLVMETKVNNTYRYQMTESFDVATQKALGQNKLPTPTMLLAQMIYDDSKTRPMEEMTIRKQLMNLNQGKMSPQKLFSKIRELEEKAAIKLSESEMLTHFTNALRKDIYAKVMEAEISDFAGALKKANLLWSINKTLNPQNKGQNPDASKNKPAPDEPKLYFCERHGENKSHNTAQCNQKGKPRNRKKKEINNIEADEKLIDDPQLVQKYNQLQKQVNELQSSKNKSESNSDKKKIYKKRTPEEEKKFFEGKKKEDYADLPTMEGWKAKKAAGDLDDDKVCRFCKSEKHLVHECTKLREYRERLKKYDKIDIVAITVDRSKTKTLPYFSLDVIAKDTKGHKFMIDSGAEMSVIHVNVAKKFGLPLEGTNTTIHGAGWWTYTCRLPYINTYRHQSEDL